ncbi:DUF2125 domain-containing protein [Thioclava sp. GXIMD4215]|uniref:DUF2125 domain-containing protein n=1 Tax=Thioclava sp. GXIMD4215 TaxID=3131928 RepID=UPI00324A89E2
MARITGVAVTATCLAMIGTAGFADVTAQDVWTNVQDLYRGMGFEVSAQSVTPNGKGLTVQGVTLTREAPGSDKVTSANSFTVSKLDFIEMGDGRVRVDIGKDIKGDSKTVLEGKPVVTAASDFRVKGADVVASGVPQNVHYDLRIDDLQMDLKQTVHQDEADFPTVVTLGLTGMKGDFNNDLRAGTKQSGTYHIDQGTLNGKGSDPAGGSFVVAGALSDISTDMSTTLPEGVTLDGKMAAYSTPGVESRLFSKVGPMSLNFDAQSEDGDASIQFKAEHGDQKIDMKDGMVFYHANGNAIKMNVKAPNMPIEASFALDHAQSGADFPIAAGKDPKPFGLDLGLSGLTLSDQVWAMLDPQGKLPHDPAHLDLKLSGHALVNQDIFSEDFATLPGAPGELRDMNLDTLHLNAVGVDLQGKGAVTFDSAAGIPWPVGKVHLALSGAKGLMSKLTDMGLLPQDQAMFAQMILGLYAKPTGDDAMETDLEFTEDGQILANGQRIQ